MTRAIIIVGNSKRFLDEALFFKNFLEEVGIHNTPIIETSYLGIREFTLKLSDMLEEGMRTTPHEPLLIVYTGHGGTTGWSLNDTEIFPYTTLIVLIKSYPAPVIIINSCCHSFSLAPYLERSGINKENASLIAAGDGETYQGIIEDIIDTWKQMLPYEPSPLPANTADDKPKVVIHIVPSCKLFLAQAISLYRKIIRAIKRWIVGLERRQQFVEEEVINFWRYVGSTLISWITLGKVSRVMLRIKIQLNDDVRFSIREVSVVSFTSHPPIYGKRWGAILDHHFFPQKT